MFRLPSWMQLLIGIALAFLLHIALPSNSDALAEIDQLLLTDVRSPEIVHPMPAVVYSGEPLLKRRPDLAKLMMIRAWLLGTYDHEGTYPNEDAYTLTFGFERFEGFADHPGKVICKNGLCSAASGACQFMPDTFQGIYNAYKQYFLTHHPETGEPIGKFHPLNQDRACLLNYIDKGGFPEILKEGNWGVTEEGRIWIKPEAIDLTFMRLCTQWASFECEPGKGYGDSNGYYDRPEYGNQNAVPIEETRKIYLKYLEQQEVLIANPISDPTTAANPPPAPAPEPKPEASATPIDPNNPEASFPEEWKQKAASGETIAGFPITSIRGPRTDPISGAAGAFHKGFDIASPEGTPIYAPLAGKAVCIPDPNPGQKVGGGNQIKFYPTVMPDVYFVMKHLVSCEDVNWDGTGDAPVIGKTGTTGYSTGPHLHLEKWLNGEHVDYPKGWIYVVYIGKLPGAKVANNVVKFDRTRIKTKETVVS